MTAPYFQRDGITLYHADCAALPSADYDLLVTDPPYGQDFKSGWSSWGKIAGDDDIAEIERRLSHALKGLGRGRHVYIFGGKFNLTKLNLSGFAELIWDKQVIGMGDLSRPWGPQHEIITFAVHEISKSNRARGVGNLAARLRKGSVLRSLRPQGSRIVNHPTEKPVDILRQLIESSSVIGETVYDPFAGSGSTLIAASIEDRIAIGCEIDERYCEIAAKRIQDAMDRKSGGAK